MADFEKGFKIVIEHEGGYVDNKFDNGGKTNWGITQKVAKQNGYTGDMKKLPIETAKEIYKKNYWDKLKLDVVHNQEVANELFDTGVNMGVRTASKFFQRSINLLNRAEHNYSNLRVDGSIGVKTIATFSSMNEQDQKYILKLLNIFQGAKYIKICEKNEDQEIFIRGWLKRVN